MGKQPGGYSSTLNAYIISKGQLLPNDWEMYKKRSGEITKCLFCNDLPAFNPVYQYAVASATQQGRGDHTDTYCCDTCCKDVMIMEETIFSFSRNQRSMSHFDNFDGSKKSPAEEALDEYEQTVLQVIHDYVEHSLLPLDWAQYMHIYPKDKAPFKNHCFFCTSLADPTGLQLATVEMPVLHCDYINGGPVSMCTSCVQEYVNANPTYLKDICPGCGSVYTIDSTEHDYRSKNKSLSRHICPACVMERDADKLDYNDEGALRMTVVPCKCCSGPQTVDHTLTPALPACDQCELEDYYVNMYGAESKFPYRVFVEGTKITRIYKRQNPDGGIIQKISIVYGNKNKGHSCQVVPKNELMLLLLKLHNNG